MNVTQIFKKASQAGVSLYLENQRLGYKVKGNQFPEDLKKEIIAHKEEIINFLSRYQQYQQDGLYQNKISAFPRESNKLPLSFAQQRLWFTDQLENGKSSQYNMPAAMRFQGFFNEDLAEQALSLIVDRHETLRTVFANQEKEAVQIIRKQFVFSLKKLDFSSFPNEEKEQKVKFTLAKDAVAPFNLKEDLMLRASLIQLSEEEGILLLNMHHIASDGWSMNILVNEFTQIYQALLAGKATPLASLEIQYADFAQWQRNYLEGEILDQQLQYWDQQLAGIPQVHSLPLDKVRPPMQTFRGASITIDMNQTVLEALNLLAKNQNATLFMVLHGAFSILLSRYSNESDIAIGTFVANRRQKELETLVGFFVNTLILRTDSSKNLSFIEYLQQVRDVNLDAQANQDVPFEFLVDRLNPVRSMSHSPLFQVMFSMDTNETAEFQLSGLTLSTLVSEEEIAKVDLTLSAIEGEEGLSLNFLYNSDLFEVSTIERMGSSLEALIQGIVTNPEYPLHDLPLLTEKEKDYLLQELNATHLDYPRESCIHQLLEAQVEQRPNHPALVFQNQQLTYQQLNERSNQLARYLKEKGVKANDLVGLCVERSLEMVIGLLGILKAGGAYVPLDPTYPRERLDYIIEDSGLRLLLTQRHLSTLFQRRSLTQVSLDHPDLIHQLEQYERDNLDQEKNQFTTKTNLAYVIYTSGSTGKPKGVMLSHQNVVNFIFSMKKILPMNGGVWLALTSLSFDISVLELWGTLVSGFKVVIAPEQRLEQSQFLKGKDQSKIDFSLFYFASSPEEQPSDLYQLLIEGAKYADSNGYSAVWTPERHFSAFGGLYPNPSITGAAIATITEKIQIRAGSCVLPINDPIRIAEDWSVIDHLSKGRIGVAFASGWNPNDFALAPSHFKERHRLLDEGIETIQNLWKGQKIIRKGGLGNEIELQLFPAPFQDSLPMWITAAANPETFRKAGEIGTHVLTHLLGQTLGDLEEKISIYRETWKKAGHVGEGQVSLMLHTFVAKTEESALEQAKEPFKRYLSTSLTLIDGLRSELSNDDSSSLQIDPEEILEVAFKRSYQGAALIGTPEKCHDLIERVQDIGVNEIACLIDFGVSQEIVLENLPYLTKLKDLVNTEQELDPPQGEFITEMIQRHQVSHLQCTPSLASMILVDQQQKDKLAEIQHLLIGGEAFPTSLAKELRLVTNAPILNMYGPTEATVWSTFHLLQESQETVPIGKALSNYQLYVVDSNLNPVPIGVAGELLLGGEGIALGYWNRPELTEERFIVSPFHDDPNQRLYKTGDLVRYLPNGNLEYLGRIDNQVKMRGFRIELGEIENRLLECEQIKSVVVLLREDSPGNKRLVAYIVLEDVSEGNISDSLKLQLKQKLPDYMLPSAFVILETLPLTPNGKIDRKALFAQETSLLIREYIAPETEIEKELAKIWAELLKLEIKEVSSKANFFELGGHSILIIGLITEINAFFGIELSIRNIFEFGNLKDLAAFIDTECLQHRMAFDKSDELQNHELEITI